MRKVLFTILLAIAALSCYAQVVSEPGKLKQLVTNTGITSLTVTGQMDARDFKFIASELNSLTTVDLSGVEIVAYEDLRNPVLGNEYTYGAGQIPTLSFSGKKTLKSIVMPATATAIGEAALAGCTSLTTITWPTTLTEVGDYAFTACTALTSVTLPASVAKVGKGAFARCSALKQVTVNSGTGTTLAVGNEAFIDCPLLTTVNLGAGLASIGDAAFAGTGIKAVDLSQYKQLTSIGNWAYNANLITSVTLSPALRTMGKGAFMYVNTLQSATLPEALEALPDYTFAGNTALTSVSLGKVKEIGDYALYDAHSVQEITVPATVNYIGTRAMAGKTGLKTVTADAVSVPALGDDVWYGVNQPAVKLLVPYPAINDYAQAAQWQEFAISYKLLLGDFDEDGRITVSDINMMIDVILGHATEFPIQADTDGDGRITVSDISFDIDCILGFSEYSYLEGTPNTNDVLHIQDFSIAPGETRDIELVLSNTELCTAMQCDITLPQGLQVVGMAGTGRSKSHTLHSATADNVVRILCYNTKGEHFAGNDGAIVKLTVTATDELSSQSTITINNIALADDSHEALIAAATTATVNNTTGVDDINAINCKVYTMGATLAIDTPQDATAQLVAINGVATPLSLGAGHNELQPGSGIYIVVLNGKSYKVVIR